MRRLTKLAEDTPKVANAKVLAAVVYKNQLISLAANSMKTDPFQLRFATDKNFNISLHAENNTLKKAIKELTEKELSKSTMYIARVKRKHWNHDGYTWGLAKPCMGCRRAISTFDLKNYVYSTDTMGDFLII